MSIRDALRPFALGLTLALVGGSLAAPVAAQSDGASTIRVTAQDYFFEGLPTSVPADTSLELYNAGVEIHELLVVRKNDGVTETWEELLALPEEEVMAKVSILGPLMAATEQLAESAITLEQEGEYLAICFIPQGMTEMPGPDTDPADLPDGLPHFMLGMIQEFVVTAPGSTPGPLPSAPPAAGRVIELEMTSAMQIHQDGVQITELNVAIGETITFRIENTAGFDHNFFIGPDERLAVDDVDGLPGIPTYIEGVGEFTWVVPENAGEMYFGCTVPGHYQLMNGTFVVGG